MNINKKLDRLAQWSKEKMGGEVRTTESDDFKALEVEMACRHDGMEKLSLSTNAYMKHLTTRSVGEGKEKITPTTYLGSSMTRHGEDFAEDSVFGQCLIGLGQANERIARAQDTFASNSSSSWLASVDRSLAQMKEYQNARKKLESRRLALDSSQSRMQRSKREDYRAEEEHRMQKVKYEESAEDVQRRMQDIIEAENDNVGDMYTFLEAELDYHDRCREILLQVKQSWPSSPPPSVSQPRLPQRSRTNTLTRVPTTSTIDEEGYPDPLRAPIPRIRSRATSAANSPRHELPGFDFNTATSGPKFSPSRSFLSSSNSNSNYSENTNNNNSTSPHRPIISRTATEPHSLRMPLRATTQQRRVSERGGEQQYRSSPAGGGGGAVDVFGDDTQHDSTTAGGMRRSSTPSEDYGYGNSNYGGAGTERSSSPASAFGSENGGAAGGFAAGMKKAPPPPPPSRANKPKAPAPPPPPPLKRSALSQSNVLQGYS